MVVGARKAKESSEARLSCLLLRKCDEDVSKRTAGPE